MPDNAEIFQKVRDASNIVDIIGEHVALKRAGREFKGLCPFHEDHRPSMAVVPHKQIFHCFVCGTGGDVFKFVKEFHKMSNGEALRFLAQKAGITLPELPRSGRGPGGGGEGPSQKEQIASANEWACSFFQKSLRSPEGKPGLDYLLSRGLTEETLEKFRLGFAPDSWTALCTAALRANNPASTPLSNDLLFTSGLIKKRQDGSPYDLFRNRVMFPILDATGGGGKGNAGRVIAFGGRVLVERRDEAGNITEAKYLNTPETPLFNKSASIYGLHLARQSIIRSRTAVVVEGYMDVIACHQVGITNVIATLGTALTPDHARILKNYAQTIVLIFDSDDAGFRAADRAMEVFVKTPLDIKIASVPDGKDPCDFCIKNGGEPFQALIDSATDALTYQWQRLQKQFHATDSLAARQESITAFLRFTAASLHSPAAAQMDPIRKGLLLSKIASLVNMPQSELPALLEKINRQNTPHSNNPPAQGSQPLGAPAQAATPQKLETRNPKLETSSDTAEAWLLGALLAKPPIYSALREDLTLSLFFTYHALANALLEYLDNHPDLSGEAGGGASLADFLSSIDDLPIAPQLSRQAIELEARASDWVEGANLSPNNLKMLQQSLADRGLSLDSLATGALQELRATRSPKDALDALSEESPTPDPTPADPLTAALQQIAAAKSRNATGGNLRITGT
jgi:DNA primase